MAYSSYGESTVETEVTCHFIELPSHYAELTGIQIGREKLPRAEAIRLFGLKWVHEQEQIRIEEIACA